MKDTNIKENIGSLKISEEVIASIANLAAAEIKGVTAINDDNIITGAIKRGLNKNSRVVLSDDTAIVNLNIAVDYGVNIENVAASIQSAVKSAVQSMAGVTVSKVNVSVTGVNFDDSIAI